MIITILLIGLLCSLPILYNIYQDIRNSKIYNIRIKWIDSNDIRYDIYSYDIMLNPCKSNWFGLKYPKDKHFPKIKNK